MQQWLLLDTTDFVQDVCICNQEGRRGIDTLP